jgi:hypothetical protein
MAIDIANDASSAVLYSLQFVDLLFINTLEKRIGYHGDSQELSQAVEFVLVATRGMQCSGLCHDNNITVWALTLRS